MLPTTRQEVVDELSTFVEDDTIGSGSASGGNGFLEGAFASVDSGAALSGSVGSQMTSGVITSTVPSSMRGSMTNFDDEPPLLEELGINFDNVWKKTLYVLIPRKDLDESILTDGDLTGPLLFAMLLGTLMLLAGKVNFGYIYGLSVIGSVSVNVMLNLMSSKSIDMLHTVSILGYSMLPLVILAGIAVVFDLRSKLGLFASMAVIIWCAAIATRFVERLAQMRPQRYLIAYPLALFYSLFALITVF